MTSNPNQNPNAGALSPNAHRLTADRTADAGFSESTQDQRAWQLLGHATPATVSHGFAARVAALATRTAQDATPSRWLTAARLGLPLAAAAALLLSVTSNLLLPTRGHNPADMATPALATSESGDLSNLARMEAALLLLPEDTAALDATALELASVDDPATLTDEQLFGLVY